MVVHSKLIDQASCLLPKFRVTILSRNAHGGGILGEYPPPSKIKFSPHPDEVGYFRYERSFCGDRRYTKPPIPSTTFRSLLVHSLQEKSLWPLFGLIGLCFGIVAFFAIPAFFKIEIWVDRRYKYSPYDWERTGHNYWKWWTTWLDPFINTGPTHQRLYVLEDLQNAMVEEARKRGTR